MRQDRGPIVLCVVPAGSIATQRNGWLCALAAVLFGAATPATKLVVDHVGAVALAGLLYLGAAVAVAPFALREQRPTASVRQRTRLLIAVVFGGCIAPILLVVALDRTPAGTVSLLLNLELVATAVIARVFLQEYIGRRAGLGIVIVVLGGVILAGTSDAGIATGAVLIAAACVCWGIDNAITASLDGYTPSQITLAKGVVAGSVSLTLGLDARRGTSRMVRCGCARNRRSATGCRSRCGSPVPGWSARRAKSSSPSHHSSGHCWHGRQWRPPHHPHHDRVHGLTRRCDRGATSHHAHLHTHEITEHAHPIDTADPHHSTATIEVLDGTYHRHLVLTHEHEHLPDIHHRHVH